VWLGQGDSASDGAKTVDAVRDWWRSFAREAARPTFLWLHLFDAHTPYEVPAWFLEDYAKRLGVAVPERTASPSTLPETRFAGPGGFLAGVTNVAWPEFQYRAAVAYQDELLRRLFTEWNAEFGSDHAFVAVIADHGEALGEHGNWYHHGGLYREVMHVPLIVVPPGGARGLRVAEPVWSLDLARTLFGVAGGSVPEECRGTDLLAFAALRERPVRRIFFEHSDLAQTGAADDEHTAIYTELEYLQNGRERAIPADTLQLFDARRDPAQQAELFEAAPELESRYRELFRAWRASALKREGLRGNLSASDVQGLEQLGY
jgi:arylsulfatase A-like enzyme